MTSLASLEDFAARIPGEIGQADTARAQAMLDDASALIRAEAGDTVAAEWDTAGVPAIVQTICMSAAKRAFLNPDGVQSLALDGHSATFATGSPDVYLTKAERKEVRRVARKSGVWTLATSRTEDPADANTDTLDTPNVQDADEIIDAGPVSEFFA